MADFFSDLKANIKKQKDAATSIKINPESSETDSLLKKIKSSPSSLSHLFQKETSINGLLFDTTLIFFIETLYIGSIIFFNNIQTIFFIINVELPILLKYFL